MKTFLSLLSAMLCAIATAQTPKTVTFYVSPDGNDHFKGTAKRPWKTPENAMQKASEYIGTHDCDSATLVFAGGEYFLTDSLCIDSLKDVTLTSAEGEEAVFTGLKKVTGWTRDGDSKILKADLRACGIEDFGEVTSSINRVDLYFNGERQTLARWPDSGFARAGKAVGETDLAETWLHIHGTKEGVLKCPDERIMKWEDEKDPILFGYWYWDWHNAFCKLGSVDREAGTFTIAEPWDKYGYRDGCRFLGMNLLCELDTTGEYYIDRSAGILYWMAPDGFDENRDEVTLSIFSRPYMITIKDCENVNVCGMTFKGGRHGAIDIENGSRCSIRDCEICCFADKTVLVRQGYGHSVDGCYLHELGGSGIEMFGGDRRSLESCGFTVRNTIVDNFALFWRIYEPAVHFCGVGGRITHCRFTNGPSSAFRLEGNDITVEYCQCFDVVTESDDQGGIDSYGDYTFRRIVVRYNHWKRICGGQIVGAAAVRFDDYVSGHIVYGNVFEHCGGCGFGGVNINGGRDNYVCNNVFYDCVYAVSGDAWVGDVWKERCVDTQEGRIWAMGGFGPAYATRYPELKAHFKDSLGTNYVYDNIVVGAQSLLQDDRHFTVSNNTVIEGMPMELEYYIKSKVLREAGLNPIPFKKIGVQKNRFLHE